GPVADLPRDRSSRSNLAGAFAHLAGYVRRRRVGRCGAVDRRARPERSSRVLRVLPTNRRTHGHGTGHHLHAGALRHLAHWAIPRLGLPYALSVLGTAPWLGLVRPPRGRRIFVLSRRA